MLQKLQHLYLRNVEKFATFFHNPCYFYLDRLFLNGKFLFQIKVSLLQRHVTMDKVFPFAIKSQKQLYFIFILISLIIALIISLAIFDWTHPYKLHLKYQSPVSVNGFVLYHDFNKDGFSEKVEITNKEEEKNISSFLYLILDQTPIRLLINLILMNH